VAGAKYVKLAADQNYASAQYFYGDCLSSGRGIQIGHFGAARYFKLAADQNCAEVQCRSLVEAAKNAKLSADQNHAAAQYLYGICLSNGEGVGINKIEAANYNKLAADQNYVERQYTYMYALC
jgi:TPR repeat protein